MNLPGTTLNRSSAQDSYPIFASSTSACYTMCSIVTAANPQPAARTNIQPRHIARRQIMRIERELMRGAGPVAVLKLLEQRPMYGYELIDALDKRSEGVLALGQSSLYPMLYNLEAKGLIEGFEQDAHSGRVRKYYRLTRKGQAQLVRQSKHWEAVVEAMRALGVVPSPTPRLGGTP